MGLVNIAIIGRTLNAPKWDYLYEILDDGIEQEVISDYNKHSIDSMLVHPKADAYIYIGTTAKVKDKPYIHLQASASEDDIDEAMSSFIKKFVSTNDNVIEDSSIDASESSITGLTVEVNGKNITLGKQDFLDLKEMLRLCEVYGFKIREVQVND